MCNTCSHAVQGQDTENRDPQKDRYNKNNKVYFKRDFLYLILLVQNQTGSYQKGRVEIRTSSREDKSFSGLAKTVSFKEADQL